MGLHAADVERQVDGIPLRVRPRVGDSDTVRLEVVASLEQVDDTRLSVAFSVPVEAEILKMRNAQAENT